MSKFSPPNVPYVQARHQGGKQRPTAIVLRSSFTPSVGGAALSIAQNWFRPSAPVESCHYVVDEDKVFRCVPDKLTAYSLPTSSRGSISINVCSEPLTSEHFWDDKEHLKVLNRTADLVAELTLAFKIAPRYLDSEAEERWMRTKWRRHGGIILKIQGAWPSAAFLANVETRIERMRHGT